MNSFKTLNKFMARGFCIFFNFVCSRKKYMGKMETLSLKEVGLLADTE